MSVASVTPLEPARDRKAQRVAMKAARKQERIDAVLSNARTPGQVAAVAFDELRIALAKVAERDANGAMTIAREIHHDLMNRANQLTGSDSLMSRLAPHTPREGSY
jgi:hypothetical protein